MSYDDNDDNNDDDDDDDDDDNDDNDDNDDDDDMSGEYVCQITSEQGEVLEQTHRLQVLMSLMSLVTPDV